MTRSELCGAISSPPRPRNAEERPYRNAGSSSYCDFRSLSERSALPYSSPELRSDERFPEGETEAGDRVLLRETLIRTLRWRGAGVIKSLGRLWCSCSALWLFDSGELSRENREAEEIAPTRTTLGAGLPLDELCGDEFRGERLCCLDVSIRGSCNMCAFCE